MSKLIEALKSGTQCDTDGVMCIVSRQACHEAADRIERLESKIERLRSIVLSDHTNNEKVAYISAVIDDIIGG
jgi:hypothetical protein